MKRIFWPALLCILGALFLTLTLWSIQRATSAGIAEVAPPRRSQPGPSPHGGSR